MPFPTVIEDALAAYLRLIDPPKEEEMKPIYPPKVVILGDSADGGLKFALLLVIRVAGLLPLAAGAVTLSPWVDLTHSLPSIMTNMMTDCLPPTEVKRASSPALDYARLPP